MTDDLLVDDGEALDEPQPVAGTYELPEFTCWAQTREEMCRAFVFQWYAGSGEIANYDGAAMVRSMDAVYEWLTAGKVPRLAKQRFPVIGGIPESDL